MKNRIAKLRWIVEKTDTGFSAYVDSLPVATTGKSLYEIKKNLGESIDFLMEEIPDFKYTLSLEISLPDLFEAFPTINKVQLAKKIGMDKSLLTQYSNGTRNVSDKNKKRIIDAIHTLGKEMLEVNNLL